MKHNVIRVTYFITILGKKHSYLSIVRVQRYSTTNPVATAAFCAKLLPDCAAIIEPVGREAGHTDGRYGLSSNIYKINKQKQTKCIEEKQQEKKKKWYIITL